MIKTGDIVLVHDNSPRITWKLAVIEELMKGKDGVVHAAKIRTAQGRTNHPIAKLIPLEVSSDVANSSSTNDDNCDTVPPPDGSNEDYTVKRYQSTTTISSRKGSRQSEDMDQGTWWAPGRFHGLLTTLVMSRTNSISFR